MDEQNQRKQNIKLFFKSAGLTAIGIILVVIGFVAAEYFFGGHL